MTDKIENKVWPNIPIKLTDKKENTVFSEVNSDKDDGDRPVRSWTKQKTLDWARRTLSSIDDDINSPDYPRTTKMMQSTPTQIIEEPKEDYDDASSLDSYQKMKMKVKERPVLGLISSDEDDSDNEYERMKELANKP